MICQILGMFRNTLTANDKYSFQDVENLLSSTQLQLSLKLKTLSNFSNQFLESGSNFKHFEKEDYRHSYFIPEITGCERVG